MISIKVKADLSGLMRYRRNLDKIELVVSATAANIENTAKKSIERRSSRGNPRIEGGKVHYAATPGKAPNQDTGYLSGNIGHKMTGKQSAEIFSNAEYSIPLEIGFIAKNGIYQGPWPFLAPAVERHAKAFRMAIQAIIKGPG